MNLFIFSLFVFSCENVFCFSCKLFMECVMLLRTLFLCCCCERFDVSLGSLRPDANLHVKFGWLNFENAHIPPIHTHTHIHNRSFTHCSSPFYSQKSSHVNRSLSSRISLRRANRKLRKSNSIKQNHLFSYSVTWLIAWHCPHLNDNAWPAVRCSTGSALIAWH